MNYYIVTKEIYDTLDKDQISYMHKSQDRTKRLVSTTETVSNKIEEFENIATCSSYTITNHSDWVGDGSGVFEWEMEKGGYIPVIDD